MKQIGARELKCPSATVDRASAVRRRAASGFARTVAIPRRDLLLVLRDVTARLYPDGIKRCLGPPLAAPGGEDLSIGFGTRGLATAGVPDSLCIVQARAVLLPREADRDYAR